LTAPFVRGETGECWAVSTPALVTSLLGSMPMPYPPLLGVAQPSRITAALLLLCGVCLSGNGSVWASCGDYLLVAHGTASSIVGRQSHLPTQPLDVHSDAMTDVAGTRHNSPDPNSPCASGRCQRAPIPGMPEGPARGFYWQPFALVSHTYAADLERVFSKWGRASNDRKALKLFLAVELRPPESSSTGN
jgi:hypothetical protein